MPSKKKKYNARFPAGRIKKIMQTDEEVGKVAQAVPVIISRTLELFVESLLTKSMQITQARNAKTLTPSHMKQCILSESRFDFLKDLVKDIPDASSQDDNDNASSEVLDYTVPKNIEEATSPSNALKIEVKADKPDEIVANFYTEQQSTSASRTPVIQYGPKLLKTDPSKLSFSVENLVKPTPLEPKLHIDLSHLNNISSGESVQSPATPLPVPELVQTTAKSNKAHSPSNNNSSKESASDNIPPLVPITRNYYGPNTGGNLYIDEDYDN